MYSSTQNFFDSWLDMDPRSDIVWAVKERGTKMTARNLNCFGQVSDDTKLASPSTLTKGKQNAGANRILFGDLRPESSHSASFAWRENFSEDTHPQRGLTPSLKWLSSGTKCLRRAG